MHRLKPNIWSCCSPSWHAIGIAIFFITDKNAKLPWYTDFIASARRSDGPAFYVPVAKLVAWLPIGYYAGVFLLLSAIDHILVCLPGLNGIYNRYLCINQVCLGICV